MKWALGLVALMLVGAVVYVRLAPQVVARWHVVVPEAVDTRAGALRAIAAADPRAVLARLVEVAAGTPRTAVLAGSVAEGRVTWVARSRLWGFPDYITAEVTPGGVRIWSRLRFGRSDLGVNAARLEDWIARL